MSICHNSVKTGTGFLDKSFGQQKMQSMNGNNSHCSNEPELSLKEELTKLTNMMRAIYGDLNLLCHFFVREESYNKANLKKN